MRPPCYSWSFKKLRAEHRLETQKVLRALRQILHYLPARRNDSADVTGSSQFCGTRWIKVEQVAV